ncbi:heme ABC transporter ATP-binding protein [Chitinophaga agrisoli]|uniref:Heme ABC transporter ATP-binding protein n=1 Tax=Chitinophaga agrisoli TaxID=2607653 RepID=A0A5B2VQ21_9BACT|nr:heme ABC transporter ATP-binding protein [Chitinophaga agrisoli]KAA2240810.1 heme ABC transporter ATP-binding protein [Chitinophaga agrisoli]
MLGIKELSLFFGAARILDRVQLQARPGELCVLMGPNGAGKSTLLRTIAGEYIHYRGSITLNGRELHQIPVAAQARQRAVLGQQLVLQMPFTVMEVAGMGRYAYYTRETSLDKAIVTYALQLLQVYDLKDRSYLTLSGGQQQRVQMARVLSQLLEAPDLDGVDYTGRKMLLLDEPVTGMDILHQQLSLQLATRLSQQGVLVLAVLHDFQLAAAYAQRIFLLKEGRLFTQGDVANVLTSAYIKSCFGVEVSVLHHPDCVYPLVATSPAGALFPSPADKAINVY